MKKTESAVSPAATTMLSRGARSTAHETARVNTGRAGRCPSRGIGARRSHASTSGGVMRYDVIQESVIPIPPISPNWLKPRKSEDMSEP
jgi:hypothetical protein